MLRLHRQDYEPLRRFGFDTVVQKSSVQAPYKYFAHTSWRLSICHVNKWNQKQFVRLVNSQGHHEPIDETPRAEASFASLPRVPD